MGIFNFNLTSPWYVAVHHGHTAMKLLRLAQDIEGQYMRNRKLLEGVKFGGPEHHELSGQNHFLTSDMFRISSASVMMFQAMMEAIINDSIKNEAVLASLVDTGVFKNKWKDALGELGQDSTSFMQYHNDIYKQFRIPTVHPECDEIAKLDELCVAKLHTGFKAGYDAYGKLYGGLGHPLDDGAWEILCNAHDLPSVI